MGLATARCPTARVTHVGCPFIFMGNHTFQCLFHRFSGYKQFLSEDLSIVLDERGLRGINEETDLMAEDGKSHLYDPKSVYQTAKIQNFSIMQAKPQKIIKLANRSRKNRVFFDQLIRMLAVELHLGSDELNRFHLMPVYVCHSHARETAHSEHYIQF